MGCDIVFNILRILGIVGKQPGYTFLCAHSWHQKQYSWRHGKDIQNLFSKIQFFLKLVVPESWWVIKLWNSYQILSSPHQAECLPKKKLLLHLLSGIGGTNRRDKTFGTISWQCPKASQSEKTDFWNMAHLLGVTIFLTIYGAFLSASSHRLGSAV